MKTSLKMLAVAAFVASQTAFACSNVFVAGDNNIAAVGRTMDLEFNTGNTFGYGALGQENVSNLNMPIKGKPNPIKWTNKYAFMGQTAFKTNLIVDGVNTAGLYAAYLDLPGATVYPNNQNVDSAKPELAVTDVTNYILGTSSSVIDALSKLKKVQFVQRAIVVKTPKGPMFGSDAVHVILRDKGGNSAVIEWLKGKNGQSEAHFYLHVAGSDQVVETVQNSNKITHIYKNTQGAVLTNAPTYGWQLKHAAKFDHLYNGNSNKKVDGYYMNGSGMSGLPGDWTPPSRFTRATQLVKNMPKPTSEKEALFLANQALQTMAVPIGGNPATSIWASMVDLKNSTYYFRPIIFVKNDLKKNTMLVTFKGIQVTWQKFDLQKIAKINQTPKGWLTIQSKQGIMVPKNQLGKIQAMIKTPTPGMSRIQEKFMSEGDS